MVNKRLNKVARSICTNEKARAVIIIKIDEEGVESEACGISAHDEKVAQVLMKDAVLRIVQAVQNASLPSKRAQDRYKPKAQA